MLPTKPSPSRRLVTPSTDRLIRRAYRFATVGRQHAVQWRLWGLLGLAACGSSSDGASDDGPSVTADSWIYVQTTVATPEGRTSFLQLVDNLDFNRLDTSRAVELAGNGRVFSDGRRLFTGSAEEPVIQRWFPDDDGALIPGERVSFSSAGISFVPFGNNFVGVDKAYLFDGVNARALVWNPTTLEVVGEVDLSSVVKDGLFPELDPGVRRGDQLFAIVQQNDFGSTALFRGIQVVVIDTRTDRVVTVFEDERCVGGFSGLQLAEDGTIYAMGDNYLVWHWFDETFPPTCVLRIRPGETRFDPDFFLDLETLLDGDPASGFFYAGDGVAYTQAMDEDGGDVDPRAEPLGFLNQPVATWWEVNLSNPVTARPLTALGQASPRSGPGFRIDGRLFIQQSEAGFAGDTTLVEITPDGLIQETFDVVGLITNLGRIDAEQ